MCSSRGLWASMLAQALQKGDNLVLGRTTITLQAGTISQASASFKLQTRLSFRDLHFTDPSEKFCNSKLHQTTDLSKSCLRWALSRMARWPAAECPFTLFMVSEMALRQATSSWCLSLVAVAAHDACCESALG